MSDVKDLAVVEQPQQLITIEPAKYVELVFEPFAKQYADAVNAVREVAYDIKTTAGMSTAIKHRAAFRDIRVASEKARKLRKAPILEIGKLLDSRAGEIEATLLPLETLFDDEIKSEEGRKESEKAAKLAAEQQRIKQIREIIDYGVRAYPAAVVGKSAAKIAAMLETLETEPITLERYQEFADEAEMSKAASVEKVREILAAQIEVEAEQARLAAEREALERQRAEEAARLAAERAELDSLRAEQEERERVAATARAEQEAKDRAERERVEAEQRAAQERAAAAMRAEQEAHEARMQAQQAELARQQAALDAARAEQERIEQARQESERRKREAEEAAQKIEADHVEALADNAAIDAARVAAEEARRIQADKAARQAEQERRVRVEFERVGPGEKKILAVLAQEFEVTAEVSLNWIVSFDVARINHMEKAA